MRDGLQLGTAYYPEHWPEERWAEDVRLMRAAGFTVVRMGEFAWSTFEPAPGEFHFDWLDRAIDLLARAGIATVLGTPTAAPPAWLAAQDPDTLAVDEAGRRVQFGNRCHYCVNSPGLHTAVARLVGALAEHFGPNPHVVGWQIDNEYNRVCTCDRCRAQFQAYLREHFGSLEALNTRWATAYWSQTYTGWEQIPIPIGAHNPGLMLAFREFVTESYRRFQRMQLDLLRPHLRPEVWTTHNFMGWYDGYDHYALAEDLDLAAWDWYVTAGHHDYLASGATHDLTRGFKRRNFWLMETQPGSVNWGKTNTTLARGEARAMAWHAVAHGADAVLYWQWRSALGGQEQYHGTLIDPSGQPRPFYTEAVQLGREFAAAGPLLAGTAPRARVALLNDYASRWSIAWQRHHRDFDYVAHLTHYYRPLAARNIAADILAADGPLAGYALVIAPALLIVDGARAAQLADFVRRGGFLMLTIRTGMKDRDNALLPSRQPGPLAEIAGVEVEDYYALLEPAAVSGPLLSGHSARWAERLRVLDVECTQVVARYERVNGWLDGQPAITVHPYGRGFVYYVGAYLDDASQATLLAHVTRLAGIRPLLETPPGVEARARLDGGGRQVLIVVNHEPAEKSVQLTAPAREELRGQDVVGELRLEAYGVAVLTSATPRP